MGQEKARDTQSYGKKEPDEELGKKEPGSHRAEARKGQGNMELGQERTRAAQSWPREELEEQRLRQYFGGATQRWGNTEVGQT